MTTKVCTKCREEKDISEFAWSIKGIQRHSHCHNCRAEEQSEYYERTKHRTVEARWQRQVDKREEARKFVFAYLSNHTCMDCGEYDPMVLTFDHVRGTKVMGISQMINQGHWLVSGGWDKTVRVWDVANREPAWKRRCREYISSIAISSDSQTIAAGCWEGFVELMRIFDGSYASRLETKTLQVRSVDFHPNGRWLALGCGNHTVAMWDILSENQVWKTRTNTQEAYDLVMGISVHKHEDILAACTQDGKIRLFLVSNGLEIGQLKGHLGNALSVNFDSKRDMLASAGAGDGLVRIWDVNSRKEIQQLRIGSEGSRTVCFSPNGELLAAASEDTKIKIWRTDNWQQLGKLEGHTDHVNCLAFSSSSDMLASASEDQTIRLWQV